MTVQQGFADPDHVGGNQGLVDHLGVLSGTGSALTDNGIPHGGPARAQSLEGLGVAAHHDGKRALPGAEVSAGDRCIEGHHALLLGLLGDFLGQARFAGRHVDDNLAGRAAVQNAFWSQKSFPHIGREPHDGEDHVALLGHPARRIRPVGAGLHQRLGFAARTRKHRGVKAGLKQMGGHAGPHHAGADPTHPGATGLNLHDPFSPFFDKASSCARELR